MLLVLALFTATLAFPGVYEFSSLSTSPSNSEAFCTSPDSSLSWLSAGTLTINDALEFEPDICSQTPWSFMNDKFVKECGTSLSFVIEKDAVQAGVIIATIQDHKANLNCTYHLSSVLLVDEHFPGEYHLEAAEAYGDVLFDEVCTDISSIYGWLYEVDDLDVEEHEPGEIHVTPDVCSTVEWSLVSEDVIHKLCGGINITMAFDHTTEELQVYVLDAVNQTGCLYMFHGGGHEEHHADAAVWGRSIGSVIIVCLMSLIAATCLPFKVQVEIWTKELCALAAGTFIGSSCFSLIPETAEVLGFDWKMGLILMFGILFGFITEKFFHSHHHSQGGHDHQLTEKEFLNHKVEMGPISGSSGHDVEAQSETPKPTEINKSGKSYQLAIINLLAEILHNFVDGLLIGATFISSTSTGVVLTVGICLHELPQELGDFGILLQAGFSFKFALLLNFLVSLTAILGTIIALAIGESSETATAHFLPFAAGLFLYLALADIVPMLLEVAKKDQHSKRRQDMAREGSYSRCFKFYDYLGLAMWVAVGIIIMGLLLLIPGHSHAHSEEGGAHGGHGH